jgi:hypothetical protein
LGDSFAVIAFKEFNAKIKKESVKNDPIVLEFDHLSDKITAVSKMHRNFTLEAVKLEIRKCEVRCANCHRRKTAKQFGWYKNKLPL